MLVLREQDILQILLRLSQQECRHLLDALWRTLAAYSKPSADKTIHQPMRGQITTSLRNTSLFMPASDTHTTTGIKVVTLPGSGGPPGGAINIFSPDGGLEGVLNAEEITAFRTALASMIPFSRFKLPDDANVVIFGSGKQAQWHLRLVLLLVSSKIRNVTVVSRRKEAVENFRRMVDRDLRAVYPGVTFDFLSWDTENYDDELRGRMPKADVICGCTPSTKPLFPDSYLHGADTSSNNKRRFISLIGSYKPNMQEVDSATLLSGSKILVDSKEACLHEAGELIMANVQADQLVEIGELYPDALDTISGNTVFKCVGMGVMDLVIGRELMNVARQRGLGVEVEGF